MSTWWFSLFCLQDYVESTYEELYQSRLNTIAEWCFVLKTRLVVVSSARETHGNPVYPTPPLSIAWTQQTPELVRSHSTYLSLFSTASSAYRLLVDSPEAQHVLFTNGQEEAGNCTMTYSCVLRCNSWNAEKSQINNRSFTTLTLNWLQLKFCKAAKRLIVSVCNFLSLMCRENVDWSFFCVSRIIANLVRLNGDRRIFSSRFSS